MRFQFLVIDYLLFFNAITTVMVSLEQFNVSTRRLNSCLIAQKYTCNMAVKVKQIDDKRALKKMPLQGLWLQY